jgi:hypothetical protein
MIHTPVISNGFAEPIGTIPADGALPSEAIGRLDDHLGPT